MQPRELSNAIRRFACLPGGQRVCLLVQVPLGRPMPMMLQISRLLVCLLYASSFSFAANASPLFTEDFNAEISVKGRHRQAQTGLPIKHGYDAMPGWTRLGEGMPAHFVEHTPGDWALMVVAREPNQNVFTLKKGFAANDVGHTYTVSSKNIYALAKNLPAFRTLHLRDPG